MVRHGDMLLGGERFWTAWEEWTMWEGVVIYKEEATIFICNTEDIVLSR